MRQRVQWMGVATLAMLLPVSVALWGSSEASLPVGVVVQLPGLQENWVSAVHANPAFTVASPVEFSPDGTLLVTYGRLYDMRTFSELEIPANHYPAQGEEDKRNGGIVRFFEDGERAISCYQDIVAWDIESGLELFRVPNTFSDGSCMLPLDLVVLPEMCAYVRIYSQRMLTADLSSGTSIGIPVYRTDSLPGPYCMQLACAGAVVSPRRDLLATSHYDGAIRLWDVASLLDVTAEYEVVPDNYQWIGTQRYSFEEDGAYVEGGYLAAIPVEMDVLSEPLTSKPAPDPAGRKALAFTGDGELLAGLSSHGVLSIWDVDTRRQVASLSVDPSSVRALSFSPDARALAVGQVDGAISLWDVESTDLVNCYQAHPDSVSGLRFSPTEPILVSTSRDGVTILWDTEYLIPGPPHICSVSAPTRFAVGSELNVLVYFQDTNTDITEAKCSLLQGPFDDFTLDLTQPPFAEHVVDQAEGEFSFDIAPTIPGSYRIQVTLVDATGLESEPFEFAFDAYTPTSPSITRVTFPSSIDVDQDQNGLVRFEDSEGDMVEAQFEIVEGDASTIEIEPGFSFDPEVEGETDGAFRFSIRATEPQTVTLSLALIDAAGLESEPYEFTFDAR